MFSLNPRSLKAVSDLGCVWGQGPRRKGCSVASRPLLLAKIPVLFSGCKVLLLKSLWAHAGWNSWWLFSRSLQCQTRTTAPSSHFGFRWSPACSQQLGGALISPVPPSCFPRDKAVSIMVRWGRAGIVHPAGLRCFVPYRVPPSYTLTHTRRAWDPGATQACLRPGHLGQVCWNTFAA